MGCRWLACGPVQCTSQLRGAFACVCVGWGQGGSGQSVPDWTTKLGLITLCKGECAYEINVTGWRQDEKEAFGNVVPSKTSLQPEIVIVAQLSSVGSRTHAALIPRAQTVCMARQPPRPTLTGHCSTAVDILVEADSNRSCWPSLGEALDDATNQFPIVASHVWLCEFGPIGITSTGELHRSQFGFCSRLGLRFGQTL